MVSHFPETDKNQFIIIIVIILILTVYSMLGWALVEKDSEKVERVVPPL